MKTAALLALQYNNQLFLPIEVVCRDYFKHLTVQKLLRKISDGSIPLPLTRMEESQKATKGVFVVDLARYLDDRHQKALREYRQLYG